MDFLEHGPAFIGVAGLAVLQDHAHCWAGRRWRRMMGNSAADHSVDAVGDHADFDARAGSTPKVVRGRLVDILDLIRRLISRSAEPTL